MYEEDSSYYNRSNLPNCQSIIFLNFFYFSIYFFLNFFLICFTMRKKHAATKPKITYTEVSVTEVENK